MALALMSPWQVLAQWIGSKGTKQLFQCFDREKEINDKKAQLTDIIVNF